MGPPRFSSAQEHRHLAESQSVPSARLFEVCARNCFLLLLLRFYCAGQRSTPHYRTLEVRPGRIKLELKYDYDCERDDTNSLLGVLMFGWDVVIVNNE